MPSAINNSCTNYRYGIAWLLIRWRCCCSAGPTILSALKMWSPPSSFCAYKIDRHRSINRTWERLGNASEYSDIICHHSTGINHQKLSRRERDRYSAANAYKTSRPQSSKGCCNYSRYVVLVCGQGKTRNPVYVGLLLRVWPCLPCPSSW